MNNSGLGLTSSASGLSTLRPTTSLTGLLGLTESTTAMDSLALFDEAASRHSFLLPPNSGIGDAEVRPRASATAFADLNLMLAEPFAVPFMPPTHPAPLPPMNKQQYDSSQFLRKSHTIAGDGHENLMQQHIAQQQLQAQQQAVAAHARKKISDLPPKLIKKSHSGSFHHPYMRPTTDTGRDSPFDPLKGSLLSNAPYLQEEDLSREVDAQRHAAGHSPAHYEPSEISVATASNITFFQQKIELDIFLSFDCEILSVSPQCWAVTGYDIDELLHQNFETYLPFDDLSPFLAACSYLRNQISSPDIVQSSINIRFLHKLGYYNYFTATMQLAPFKTQTSLDSFKITVALSDIDSAAEVAIPLRELESIKRENIELRLFILGMTNEVQQAAMQRKTTARKPRASNQSCTNCGSTSSPEWRRGPSGPKTLCNACGLRYAKKVKGEKE